MAAAPALWRNGQGRVDSKEEDMLKKIAIVAAAVGTSLALGVSASTAAPVTPNGLCGAANMTNAHALPGMLNAMSLDNANGVAGMFIAVANSDCSS
jgi:hypothetical protein